jgi:hypothetical protein
MSALKAQTFVRENKMDASQQSIETNSLKYIKIDREAYHNFSSL